MIIKSHVTSHTDFRYMRLGGFRYFGFMVFGLGIYVSLDRGFKGWRFRLHNIELPGMAISIWIPGVK